MEKQDNSQLMTAGFRTTLSVLVPYIINELRSVYGEDWWRQGVYSRLPAGKQGDYPMNGSIEDFTSAFDISLALHTIENNWREVFQKKLPRQFRSWVHESLDYRNELAHQGIEEFTDTKTARALENMALMCGPLDNAAEASLQRLVRCARYGNDQGSVGVQPKRVVVVKRKDSPSGQLNALGLRPWREVMAPHPDVANGEYRNAEFAADLAQVIGGTAPYEYMDPVEFFGRTYLTKSLKSLLVTSLKQITGQKGGDPVIELKTSFGGGKTHSMLALYHMLDGKVTLDRVPMLADIARDAGLIQLPKAHIAVIVGTALNPNNGRRPSDMPGITINTMWGEIVYQLAKSCNDPSLYDLIKSSDSHGSSPGSARLAEVFNRCGSTLILIDELVAYGRKLYGVNGLPAGSYGNFLTFIQELTEAACTAKNCLLVTSIPESDNEIGGEAGQKVLAALTHYFERKESIWEPVGSKEGFEVVRRRLFGPCIDEKARDAVCEAFGKMYRENPQNFPLDCRQPDYIQQMKDCYPIHPEMFAQLYDDWATLEKFQRTRGVLRLMAAVINQLWEANDQSLLIIPSSLLLGKGSVAEELIRYLPPEWRPIVDSEVDGVKSRSVLLEKTEFRFGQYQAGRKVARTLFFDTAPQRGVQNRGVDETTVLLGCMQPGDSIPVYQDMLGVLSSKLSYLYASQDRYWFDIRPTLRKLMEDKASRIGDDVANEEIKNELRNLGRGEIFSQIHVAPNASLDVPEDDSARLVLLSPMVVYNAEDPHVADGALGVIHEYLANHGNGPRVNKNMLVFSMADSGAVFELRLDAKRYLAWKDIDQNKESETSYTRSDLITIREGLESTRRSLLARLNAAYSWLVIPTINLAKDPRTIQLEPMQVGGADNLIQRIEDKIRQEEAVVTAYGPGLLKMTLDRYFFKDRSYVQIRDLWKAFCAYCYLPRLKDFTVLSTTIRKGLESDEYFAIADGVNESGVFTGLKYGVELPDIDQNLFLVDIAKARTQRKEKKATVPATGSAGDQKVTGTPSSGPFGPFGPTPPTNPSQEPTDSPRTFYLSKTLNDKERVTKDVGRIVQEILTQIWNVEGNECSVKLEIDAKFPPGKVDSKMQRDVEENCRQLGIDEFGFDK